MDGGEGVKGLSVHLELSAEEVVAGLGCQRRNNIQSHVIKGEEGCDNGGQPGSTSASERQKALASGSPRACRTAGIKHKQSHPDTTRYRRRYTI